jgi:hypothetical protein
MPGTLQHEFLSRKNNIRHPETLPAHSASRAEGPLRLIFNYPITNLSNLSRLAVDYQILVSAATLNTTKTKRSQRNRPT